MSLDKEKAYFTQAYEKNLSAYNNQLNDESLDSLKATYARSLADLATRLQIIEELLVAEQRDESDSIASNPNMQWPLELSLPSEEIGANPNLHDLEHYEGNSFRWTAVDPRTDIVVRFDRQKEKELHINLAAVIKPEFVKELKVLIDDREVEAEAREFNNLIQLVANVPAQKDRRKPTLVSLIVPSTHSPSEVGSGFDVRKLGVAIHSISVRLPSSRIKKLFG